MSMAVAVLTSRQVSARLRYGCADYTAVVMIRVEVEIDVRTDIEIEVAIQAEE